MDFTTDIFIGGRDGYNTYRIPAVIEAPDGTVLCFCEGRKHSPADDGAIDLLLKRSTDGGRTWSAQEVVRSESGEITMGNPCPIVEKQKAAVHLLFCRNNKQMFHTRSDDSGASWREPLDITSLVKEFDFSVVRMASGPVHGIEAASGRLIAPIWLCNGMPGEPGLHYRSAILYSDDSGRTWKRGGIAPPVFNGLNECTVFERSDHTLVLNMRGAGNGFRAASTSRDGGLTWSTPAIEKQLPCPICQAGILGLGNREVLFSNPDVSRAGLNTAGGRRNMTVKLSRDDGVTWSASRVLNEGPSGYSDLAVLNNGTILCVYERGEDRYYEEISVAGFTRDWLIGDHSNT